MVLAHRQAVLGLALIASLSVAVPLSLAAAVAEDVLKRPFTPPGKKPPEEALAAPKARKRTWPGVRTSVIALASSGKYSLPDGGGM